MKSKKTFGFELLALVALFFIWRFFIFYFTHPDYFPDTYEEVYRGMVARELTSGTTIPLWHYRPDNYAGGFYVTAVLLPFFQFLLGPGMLSLKAYGILQTGLALLVWYAVLVRYVNRRTAVYFSLLYIFAPFHLVTLSSLALGDHAETVLLSALTVLLFFRIRELPPNQRTASYAALGLLAGFSLWFAYIYAITLAALLIFYILNRPAISQKAVAATAAGFAAGFSFWLVFNFHEGFSGLIVQGSTLSDFFTFQNRWKPFVLTLFENRALSFYDMILGVQFVYLAVLPIWFLLTHGSFKDSETFKWRSTAVGFSVFYSITFILVLQSVDRMGARFLVPLYPFILVPIAFGFASLSNRRFAIAGVSFFLVLSLFGIFPRFSFQHAGEYLSRRGYSVKTLSHVLSGIRPRIESVLSSNFSLLNPEDQADYIMAYVDQLDFKSADEIQAASVIVPANYRNYYEYLAGREMMLRTQDPEKSVLFFEPLRISNPRFYTQALKGVHAFEGAASDKDVAASLFTNHLESYSSSLVWRWNDLVSRLDENQRRDLENAFEKTMQAAGLPKEALPFKKMKKMENK